MRNLLMTLMTMTLMTTYIFLSYFQSLTIFFEKNCEKGGTFLHFLVICI